MTLTCLSVRQRRGYGGTKQGRLLTSALFDLHGHFDGFFQGGQFVVYLLEFALFR